MVRHAAPRGSGKHCHCCRQKRPPAQLIPCGASQGEGGAKHGPWCHRCILTKLHKNPAYISAATAAAREGLWKCPRCHDICPCNKCLQRRTKDGPREGRLERRPSGTDNLSSEEDFADDSEVIPSNQRNVHGSFDMHGINHAECGNGHDLHEVFTGHGANEVEHSDPSGAAVWLMAKKEQCNPSSELEGHLVQSAHDGEVEHDASSGSEHHPSDSPSHGVLHRSEEKPPLLTHCPRALAVNQLEKEPLGLWLSRRSRYKTEEELASEEGGSPVSNAGKMLHTARQAVRTGQILAPPLISSSMRKTPRKGTPLRGKCGVDFGPVEEGGSPLSPCRQASRKKAIAPEPRTDPAKSLMSSFVWDATAATPRRSSLGGLASDKGEGVVQEHGIRKHAKDGTDVSIEKLKQQPPIKVRGALGSQTSRKHESETAVHNSFERIKRSKKLLLEEGIAPNSKKSKLAKPQVVSKAAIFTDKEKSLAAAVAAALRACNAGGLSYQSPSHSYSTSEEPCKSAGSEDTPMSAGNSVKKKTKFEPFQPPPAREERKTSDKAWVPPVSPFGLVQEKLYKDPWKLLVACMLLNKTAGHQMHKVIWNLFDLIPTPEAAVSADTEEIAKAIHSLGLYRKRANMIQRFSSEYLQNDWVDVRQLHGIGKYASDAYAIFCEGRWKEVHPEDHMLAKYWKWLHETSGHGYAFTH